MINAKSPKCGRAPYGTTLLASLYLKFKKAQKKKTNEKGKKQKKGGCQACNLQQQRSAKEEENSTGSSISGCVGGSLVRRRMDRGGRDRRSGEFCEVGSGSKQGTTAAGSAENEKGGGVGWWQ